MSWMEGLCDNSHIALSHFASAIDESTCALFVQVVNALVLPGFLHGSVMAQSSSSLFSEYLLGRSTKYRGLLLLNYYTINGYHGKF